MHPANTRTEALLLSILIVSIVVRHFLANGPVWPEPLEIYTVVELVLRAANQKHFNGYNTKPVARSQDATCILNRSDEEIR